MIDLRWLREDPAAFDASLTRRGAQPAAHLILAADEERRRLETSLQEEQALRNRLSKEIGELKRRGEDANDLMARVAELKELVQTGEIELRAKQAHLDELLASYPNPLAADVPDGPDESHNREERRVGALRNFAFEPQPHEEIGRRLGLDLERAAKLAGARMVLLKGDVARLHRALAQFMLDVQTQEHGYTEVDPPYLVRDEVMFGTAQLPKFAADSFRTTAGNWLIPTSEVPLTNIVREEILDEAVLPLRFSALTPCFRSEAGAAGRDTKGMFRVHQFMKVELVSITAQEQAEDEHERMVGCAEAVLQRLELPYRVVTLAAGDTGFASRKSYDIEVWLPGQGNYREVSSCSNCGDFQARRMNARYRNGEGRGLRFVHTLNGSGVAVGRALIAVLENYQEEDGSLSMPEALRPYMGGVVRLQPR